MRDTLAVAGARETVVGLLVRAREEALSRGEAVVVLRSVPGTAWLTAGGAVRDSVDLEARFGVRVALGGGREVRELRWGPLGVGRVANVTVGFARGEASADLIVSAYGRVRRR